MHAKPNMELSIASSSRIKRSDVFLVEINQQTASQCYLWDGEMFSPNRTSYLGMYKLTQYDSYGDEDYWRNNQETVCFERD